MRFKSTTLGASILSSICALMFCTGFTLMPSAGVDGARWHQFPIRFRYNTAHSPIEREQMSRVLAQALELWNGVEASNLQVRLEQQTTVTADMALSDKTTENVIVFDDHFRRHFPLASKAALAVGKAFHDSDGYNRGVIVINAAAVSTGDLERLKIIVAHEAGHVFGIGHASERSALMYPIVREVGKLGDDDIAAITFLYPRKEGLGSAPLGCASIHRLGDQAMRWYDDRRIPEIMTMFLLFLLWPIWRLSERKVGTASGTTPPEYL